MEMDLRRYFWLGRAAAWGYAPAITKLQSAATKQVRLFEGGSGSSRLVVWEIGAACKDHVVGHTVFGVDESGSDPHAIVRAVQYYDRWCDVAKRAIQQWLMVARRVRLVKDLRTMIARMAWEERSAWCCALNI